MRTIQNSQEELKSASEYHGAMLTKILQWLDELKTNSKDSNGSTGQSSTPGPSFGNNGDIHTHTMKLEFPRFDVENPSSWLFKDKQYLGYHQVLEEQWLTISSLNMEGEALEWYRYQWYIDYQP